MDVRKEVLEAESRIRPHIRETPLEPSPSLSGETGAEVFLKLECQQTTGSFKLRGAINKFLSLTEEERSVPVVTASSGNHAAAVAHTLATLGGRGIIYLPENVAPAKVAALEPYRLQGVEIRFHGDDCVMSELRARDEARAEGYRYISPYSDPRIIGGQGTVGLELERQSEGRGFDAVFVPVGGGGLIGGIAGYLKATDPKCRIIACQPSSSAVMTESVRAGRILELPSKPTLADGTAGGVDPETVTLGLCRKLVDEWVLVSEDELAAAIRLSLETHHLLIEGAAALTIAALRQRASADAGRRVALVLSGKKISLETLSRVLLGSNPTPAPRPGGENPHGQDRGRSGPEGEL